MLLLLMNIPNAIKRTSYGDCFQTIMIVLMKRLDTINIWAQLLKQNATDENNIGCQTITRTRNSYKKIPCSIRNSVHWGRIVENDRIF